MRTATQEEEHKLPQAIKVALIRLMGITTMPLLNPITRVKTLIETQCLNLAHKVAYLLHTIEINMRLQT